MTDDNKIYMFESHKEDVKGSVAVKDGRTIIIVNGIDDGSYDINFGDRFICKADTRGKGRIFKKIDENFTDERVIISKDGEEFAWINVKEENTEPVGQYNCMDLCESEKTDEENVDEQTYGFSSDLSTVINRFKEQIERLENMSVLTMEDIKYIENKDLKEEWDKITPDYIWKLPVKDIRFPSSPFCICGYMKYNYLLMKEMSDRYRIGVPDRFKSENMPYASSYGFYCFDTFKEKEANEGEEGYWLYDILKN